MRRSSEQRRWNVSAIPFSSLGRHIPNEMGRVTCDWCDVLMCGSWEEVLPFLPLIQESLCLRRMDATEAF